MLERLKSLSLIVSEGKILEDLIQCQMTFYVLVSFSVIAMLVCNIPQANALRAHHQYGCEYVGSNLNFRVQTTLAHCIIIIL